MGTIIKRVEYVPIEPGVYPATVEAVEVEDGQYGPQVTLRFRLDDNAELGVEDRVIIGWASAKFGPKAKLYGWVRSLLFGGRDIPADFKEFDVDLLKGRRVLLSVGVTKKADGEFNNIIDLLPLRARATLAQPAATPASSPATIGAGNGNASRPAPFRLPDPDEDLPF